MLIRPERLQCNATCCSVLLQRGAVYCAVHRMGSSVEEVYVLGVCVYVCAYLCVCVCVCACTQVQHGRTGVCVGCVCVLCEQ